ncbi:hypothetical protein SUGI_0374470 [Cryptomeria japonica]|nr:hypothetical protein SUGI_0374470 [Cryptomeria japonica]
MAMRQFYNQIKGTKVKDVPDVVKPMLPARWSRLTILSTAASYSLIWLLCLRSVDISSTRNTARSMVINFKSYMEDELLFAHSYSN